MADLATSTNYLDWQKALYEVLYAEDMARGGIYIYDWIRQGGLTDADVATIRDGYLTYKKTRQNAPASTPNHPDTGAAIRGTYDQGNPAVGR
jgi:hypothetical protein